MNTGSGHGEVVSKDSVSSLTEADQSPRDDLIQQLQEELTQERDKRKEDRFVGIVLIILLFDIVFFTVMPTFGGPLAVLVLQLLILIPLARRMGMEGIALMIDRVLDRMAGGMTKDD